MSWEFVKIYRSILDSSISFDHIARHVFMDLLLLADADGKIDMPLQIIARRTGWPVHDVDHALAILCEPDPLSRSKTEEGRRLVPIPDAGFGWIIVNFRSYADKGVGNSASSTEAVRDWRKRRGVTSGHARTAPFSPPTVEEITAEIASKGGSYTKIDPVKFFNYYEARGWLLKGQPMKSWRAALATWDRNNHSSETGKPLPPKTRTLADLIRDQD
jgi:hypothetical protein